MKLMMLLLEHTAFCVMKFCNSTLKCDLADELGIRTCYQILTGSNPIQVNNFIVAGNCNIVALAVDYFFFKWLWLNIRIKYLQRKICWSIFTSSPRSRQSPGLWPCPTREIAKNLRIVNMRSIADSEDKEPIRHLRSSIQKNRYVFLLKHRRHQLLPLRKPPKSCFS